VQKRVFWLTSLPHAVQRNRSWTPHMAQKAARSSFSELHDKQRMEIRLERLTAVAHNLIELHE
jgi:hypothetical protein